MDLLHCKVILTEFVLLFPNSSIVSTSVNSQIEHRNKAKGLCWGCREVTGPALTCGSPVPQNHLGKHIYCPMGRLLQDATISSTEKPDAFSLCLLFLQRRGLTACQRCPLHPKQIQAFIGHTAGGRWRIRGVRELRQEL